MAFRFAYDPTVYHQYFNDFESFTAGDWSINTVETGANSATEAISNERGGVLVLTNDIADDDADWLQWTKETFKWTSGKRMHFKSRMKLNEKLQSEFVMGLQITDTTPLDASDGIYFRKLDGVDDVYLVVVKNGTESTLKVHDLVDDTYVVLEWLYDGGDHIKAFVDGVQVGRVALTNVPDDEELAVSFGVKQGEATNAKVMSIDYIFALEQR